MTPYKIYVHTQFHGFHFNENQTSVFRLRKFFNLFRFMVKNSTGNIKKLNFHSAKNKAFFSVSPKVTLWTLVHLTTVTLPFIFDLK